MMQLATPSSSPHPQKCAYSPPSKIQIYHIKHNDVKFHLLNQCFPQPIPPILQEINHFHQNNPCNPKDLKTKFLHLVLFKRLSDLEYIKKKTSYFVVMCSNPLSYKSHLFLRPIKKLVQVERVTKNLLNLIISYV